ncbi:MAG: hypothetical protein P8N76_12495 [Pirellulaceae bacterium]|nr:hypothetical protein [Planctomycetaceae bacterium]MDG2382481.1 hypothetical protein [Pirellulaceae bacterium]
MRIATTRSFRVSNGLFLETVFAERESFHGYLDRLKAISTRFAEYLPGSMKLKGESLAE